MNGCLKVVLLLHATAFFLLGGLFWAILTNRFPAIPDVPELEDVWFGEGLRPAKEDTAIRPFKINISDMEIKDFKTRLANDLKRMKDKPVDPLVDSFDYGMNSKYLVNTFGDYWLNKYDWRKSEKKMNAMGEHYMTNIDGMDVHFVRVKPTPQQSKGKKVIPLLLSHGWPGSFVEFINIAPILTKPSKDTDFVFDLVIPGIPGFAFSSAPKKPGFHYGQCAKVFKKLMNRLGFETFYNQGGDWGSGVTASMAVLYPETIIGHHTNLAFSKSLSAMLRTLVATYVSPSLVGIEKHEEKFLGRLGHLLSESGYNFMQSTRPDSVGLALHTTPLGWASYIIEKAGTFDVSNNGGNAYLPDGGISERFTLDELMDIIMIYWWNGAVPTSMRFYREGTGRCDHAKTLPVVTSLMRNPIRVPTGIANSETELFVQPKAIVSDRYVNIFTYHELPKTGHFAAYQSPQLLANSIFEFVAKVEEYEKLKIDNVKSEL